jgi:hypothetical protein
MDIVQIIEKYGLPILACGAMGYLIYYVWKWTTTEIKVIIKETSETLISLIDRIRMLDNDLIRLDQKMDTILQMKEQFEKERCEFLKQQQLLDKLRKDQESK